MPLRMWTYDLAREQVPTLDHMRRFCDLTLESGYDAIGLYLEHRFAYPSTPWSHGKGCLTPETVQILQNEYKTLQIIPFINLLGHFEGFLYTEAGVPYAESKFNGMQACPSKPDFFALAERLLQDTLDIFSSHIVHVGGDETFQLGSCPQCRRMVTDYEKKIGVDGKANLYADHFAPLLRKVVDNRRRPAIWGDMFHEHPKALNQIPKQTLIFDWQYFQSCRSTAQIFRKKGLTFDVVYCPTLHTYNATWMHLPQSERNVRENVIAAEIDNAYGVCLTTWECDLFGNYETLIPAIKGAGRLMSQGAELAKNQQDKWSSDGSLQLVIHPTEQLPDPQAADVISISVGIADSIIANFLESRSSEAVLFPSEEKMTITQTVDGAAKEAGQLPAEQAHGVLNRLGLIANMDPLKRPERRMGRITGEYKGIAFKIDAFSEPIRAGIKFTLKTEPWKNTTIYAEERKAEAFLKAYLKEGETYEEWARLMGVELQNLGGMFEFGGIRSGLKCRLLLYSNPFLAWLHHRDDLCGPIGDKALDLFERGIAFAPDVSARGVSEFAKHAVLFVRFAEEAHKAYAAGNPGAATAALSPCRQVFDALSNVARASNLRIGGSLADIERCARAKEHVERVIRRIKQYGDGSLGYLPSFEMITHPQFMPHDQGAWWLINDWANE